MNRSKLFFALTIMAVMLVSLVLSCKSKEHTGTTGHTTVLVQLHSDNVISTLEENYKEYSLKKEKTVSRPMNIHQFGFDAEKVSDTALIRLLKQSSLVKEAQTNKEITPRKN
ncbi:MAG: hypothetical protein K0U54_01360 [Bacteroidetes bacterium]|nr:hypothetical protein [Bacteroidota bacterium]